MKTVTALLCIPLTIVAIVGHAEIYTWVDAQGVRHYSDNARGGKAERAELPGIQSMAGDPDALEKLRAQQDASKQTSDTDARSREPRLVEPISDATFRDAGGIVPVAVAFEDGGGLRDGEQLTYYLDGSPIPQSPTDQTRLKLGQVARGRHTLSVALLYRGREIRRTPPVTFHMKPPSAISPINRPGGDGEGENTPDTPGATTAPPATSSGGAPAAPRFNTTSSGSGSP